MSKKTSRIEISIRMRPILKHLEDEEGWLIHDQTKTIYSQVSQINTPINNDSILMKRRYADSYFNYSFQFDNVFGPSVSTSSIYQEAVKKLIHQITLGINSTVFMYGQTTSGKTYTMLGDQNNPGILPFALLEVFEDLTKLKQQKNNQVQIYNEQVNDLLDNQNQNLKIVDDKIQGAVVSNLSQYEIETFEEAMALLRIGEENRQYKERQFHDHSSRSHTIFQLKINQQGKQKNLTSILNLVDLAGSERLQQQDGEIKAEGNEETGFINKSLFILSNVISKLAEGKKGMHIPYRDSKLTRILQNVLNGNSHISIICTLSPAMINFYQTLSTLRFASRAKKVQISPLVNFKHISNQLQNNDVEELQSQIKGKNDEIELLKKENQRLMEFSKGNNDEFRKNGQILQNSMFLPKYDNLGELLTFGLYQYQSQDQEYEQICDLNQQMSRMMELYMNELQQAKSKLSQSLIQLNCNTEQKKYFQKILDNNYSQVYQDIIHQINEKSILQQFYVSALLDPNNQETNDLMLVEKAYNDAINQITHRQSIITTTLNNLFYIIQSNHIKSIQCQNRESKTQLTLLQIIENAAHSHQTDLTKFNLLCSEKQKILDVAFNEIKNNFKNHTSSKQEDVIGYHVYGWGFAKDHRLGNQNLVQVKKPIKLFDHPMIKISAACQHSAAIDSNNNLYMWGKFLQTLMTVPTYIPMSTQIVSVSCGFQHTMLIDTECNVYSFGLNNSGQLGLGDFFNREKPTLIAYFVQKDLQIIEISCGYIHSGALTINGQFYSWGNNEDGRLMIGDINNFSIPQQAIVNGFGQINQIYLGVNNTIVICNGEMYGAGNGSHGQLGIIQDDQWRILVKKFTEKGEIVEECTAFTKILKQFEVKQIAIGEDFTAALDCSGKIWTIGRRASQCLGFQNIEHDLHKFAQIIDLEDIIELKAGKRHCLALKSDGTVFAWGFNFYDQLGQTQIMKLSQTPKMVVGLECVAAISSGELFNIVLMEN